jgi:hypothetical protein
LKAVFDFGIDGHQAQALGLIEHDLPVDQLAQQVQLQHAVVLFGRRGRGIEILGENVLVELSVGDSVTVDGGGEAITWITFAGCCDEEN